MSQDRIKLIKKCELKLKQLKDKYQRSLARPTAYSKEGSEVIDMAAREEQIQSSMYFRDRMKRTLPEITKALHRIKEGTYGLCVITGEEIEGNRLLAVPWTRISMKAHSENMI
jgi:DnaK suppressor protein